MQGYVGYLARPNLSYVGSNWIWMELLKQTLESLRQMLLNGEESSMVLSWPGKQAGFTNVILKWIMLLLSNWNHDHVFGFSNWRFWFVQYGQIQITWICRFLAKVLVNFGQKTIRFNNFFWILMFIRDEKKLSQCHFCV